MQTWKTRSVFNFLIRTSCCSLNQSGKYVCFHTNSLLAKQRNQPDEDAKPKKRPPELDYFPGKEFTLAWQIKHKGKIYDRKPFKFFCEKDKAYLWCACGLSKTQPFCDGSHDGPLLRSILKPVLFIAPETKDYWFCNCKQTSHRPLCDGTHKKEDIQTAVRS